MSDVTVAAGGGRAAAIARRKALSAGKAALPPAQERVRAGGGVTMRATAAAAPQAPAATVPAATVTAVAPQPAAAPQPVFAVSATGGRQASIQRRRQLSIGKAALTGQVSPSAGVPASHASASSGSASGVGSAGSGAVGGRQASIARRRQLSIGKSALQSSGQAQHASPPPQAAAAPSAPPLQGCSAPSCKDVARARRAALARGGAAALAAPQVVSGMPVGVIVYPPKVTESGTQGGQRVTGIRIGEGRQVTGDERGTLMPVSGTPYIDTDSGTAYRPASPKVGQMRTAGGQTVSGTLVRSQVRITGDEAGGSVGITGKVDPRLEDDVTSRGSQAGFAIGPFRRPVGQQAGFASGAQGGRSGTTAGSRERSRAMAIETTEKGQVITGSALGRSTRMTGDETGACRSVTGNQYLAPARAQAACSAVPAAAGRADPVTGAKVSTSESWGGQRITGMDVEHNPRVTGDEPGSCAALTGSQYQGRSTAGWCDASAAGAAAARRAVHAGQAVTGDTPLHGTGVTGIARGAGRDITGTPYQAAAVAASAMPADPVAAIDTRFSVRSPQRAAHVVAKAAAQDAAGSGGTGADGSTGRITGSFAVGGGKVTGNGEFLPRPRSVQTGDKPAAHNRISGEGIDGGRLTGDAWGTHSAVTGTDGAFAADRNPSQRGPKAKAFAGSTVFKSQAVTEEPRQLVTGMFYFAKSGARVTLSGGAQG